MNLESRSRRCSWKFPAATLTTMTLTENTMAISILLEPGARGEFEIGA